MQIKIDVSYQLNLEQDDFESLVNLLFSFIRMFDCYPIQDSYFDSKSYEFAKKLIALIQENKAI